MFVTETLLDCGGLATIGLFGPRAVVEMRWTDGWFQFCVSALEKYERLILVQHR